MFVVFKGTNNIQDGLTDLQFSEGESSELGFNEDTKLKVHNGFYNNINKTQEFIYDSLIK